MDGVGAAVGVVAGVDDGFAGGHQGGIVVVKYALGDRSNVTVTSSYEGTSGPTCSWTPSTKYGSALKPPPPGDATVTWIVSAISTSDRSRQFSLAPDAAGSIVRNPISLIRFLGCA